jgi:hypothetical protein
MIRDNEQYAYTRSNFSESRIEAMDDPDKIFDIQRIKGHSRKHRGKHRSANHGAGLMAFFRNSWMRRYRACKK